jgi:outer membrane protein OmpA-like peptidoglycan-associated protein
MLVLNAQTPIIISTPAQSPGATMPANTEPLYRVTIVQGSAKAINYRNLKSSTKIELKGTALAQAAMGEAKVKSEGGAIHIGIKVKDLPLASSFGSEFLTYVVWGISPEGRATNLGELVLKHGKGKVAVVEPLQSFGLVVTAEPYFAVTRPSDVVIMENVVGKDAKDQFEVIDAKYELLKRGQYALNGANAEPMLMDKKTPFDLYQARNAVRIARAAGANVFAEESYGKAENYLKLAETTDGGKKGKIMNAREAVQRAEDARAIAGTRQEAERVAMDKNLAQGRLDEANRAAVIAAAAQEAALKQNAVTNNENENLRVKLMDQLNGILQTRATARGLIVNMSGMLFHTGKSTLLPAAREKLAKVAGILSAHKGLRIEAEGFTDSKGTEAFNMKLSEARAQSTKDYLVSQGVSADAISSKGFGVDRPIAPNTTEAGRKENRRVELVVSGGGLGAAKL